jgi:hypothetical protein
MRQILIFLKYFRMAILHSLQRGVNQLQLIVLIYFTPILMRVDVVWLLFLLMLILVHIIIIFILRLLLDPTVILLGR